MLVYQRVHCYMCFTLQPSTCPSTSFRQSQLFTWHTYSNSENYTDLWSTTVAISSVFMFSPLWLMNVVTPAPTPSCRQPRPDWPFAAGHSGGLLDNSTRDYHQMCITGWWFGTCVIHLLLFHSVGNVIIPTDELHSFSEGSVGIPPTRLQFDTLRENVCDTHFPSIWGTWDPVCIILSVGSRIQHMFCCWGSIYREQTMSCPRAHGAEYPELQRSYSVRRGAYLNTCELCCVWCLILEFCCGVDVFCYLPACSRGYVVLWIRCHWELWVLALWPWVQCFAIVLTLDCLVVSNVFFYKKKTVLSLAMPDGHHYLHGLLCFVTNIIKTLPGILSRIFCMTDWPM